MELTIFIASKIVQNDNTAAGGEQECCSPEEADHGIGAEREEKIMEEVRNWLKRGFRNSTQSQRTSLEWWAQVDVEKAESDSIKPVSRMDTGLTLVEEASEEDIGCYKNFQVVEV